MIRTLIACLLIGAFIAAPPVHAGSHEQAEASAATAGERSARVAGGGQVQLADSAKSNKQWAEARPNYNDLKPKKR